MNRKTLTEKYWEYAELTVQWDTSDLPHMSNEQTEKINGFLIRARLEEQRSSQGKMNNLISVIQEKRGGHYVWHESYMYLEFEI